MAPRKREQAPAQNRPAQDESQTLQRQDGSTSSPNTAGASFPGASPSLPEDDRNKARRQSVQQNTKPAKTAADLPVMVPGATLQDIDAQRQEIAQQDDGSRTQGFRKQRLTADGPVDAEELEPLNDANNAPRNTLYKSNQRLANPEEVGIEAPAGFPSPVVNRPYGSQPVGVDVKTGVAISTVEPNARPVVHGSDQDADVDAGASARMRVDVNAGGDASKAEGAGE